MVGKETGGKRLAHVGSNRVKTNSKNGRHRHDIPISHKKRLPGNNGLDNQKRGNASNESRWKKLHSTFVVILAVLFGFFNSYHQSTMFENDRHFSHLSSLEREMTFRTEMGLYYSYFKTIIDAPSLWNGIYQIMNDNLTEYPTVINTLQRFNLYPEVLLGVGYRTFQEFARYFDLHTKECWEVIRGDGLHPVESCEGLGEPAYFYTTSVFLLNGLVGSVVFLYGNFLSNSILGGVLAASCFFFNHGECTRVQWTPPLRESFGYPLFFLEMLIVTVTVRNPRTNWNHSVVIAVVTTLFMLFWQFAQFALLTQTLAAFGTYILNFMPAVTLQCVLKGQIIGLLAAVIFLFRNNMLLASFYASTLITVYLITLLEKPLTKMKKTALILFSQLVLLLVGSLGLKALFSLALNVFDDVHIWNILRSKFTSYRDFHTMLYTCAPEFDFLEQETLIRLTKTLLLPVGLMVYFAVSIQNLCPPFPCVVGFDLYCDFMEPIYCINRGMHVLFWKRRKVKDPVAYDDASVMYNLLQFLAFFIMAIVIMRLKLFFTPHLCLIASLIMSKKHFSFLSKTELRYSFMAVLLSVMAVQGIQNIQHQRRILGEYSNPDLEELIMWMNRSTSTEAVFAGSMPTMANLMLSTRRPIVNHPHYEDAGLRERTYRVYQIYSRKSPSFVYQTLSDMFVNFVVIEKNWCFGKSRDGCAMVDIWDMEDVENRGKESLCQRLYRDPTPFTNVFHNSKYTVLSL